MKIRDGIIKKGIVFGTSFLFICVAIIPATGVPIVIENLGNGKTTVHNNIIDYPQEWIIIIPSHVVLEVNESKEVNLSITPPENFTGIEAIKIAFTPKYFYNPIFEGTTLYVYIVVRCKP